jgi:hypothetical protein
LGLTLIDYLCCFYFYVVELLSIVGRREVLCWLRGLGILVSLLPVQRSASKRAREKYCDEGNSHSYGILSLVFLSFLLSFLTSLDIFSLQASDPHRFHYELTIPYRSKAFVCPQTNNVREEGRENIIDAITMTYLSNYGIVCWLFFL